MSFTRRLAASWQATLTNPKVPVLGLFAAAGLIALAHGLATPVLTPYYWPTVGALAAFVVGAAIPDWRSIPRIWRIPLLLSSLLFPSLILYLGGFNAYTGLSFLLPLGVAPILVQGYLRLGMQVLTMLVGTALVFYLTGGLQWEWIVTTLTITITNSWMMDQLVGAISREASRTRHFKVISETAHTLLHRTGEELLESVCQQALGAFGATQCVLMQATPDRTGLVATASAVRAEIRDFVEPHLAHVPVDRGLTGWVFRTGEPVLLGDARRDPRAFLLPRSQGPDISAMILPVLADDGSVRGVLRITGDGLNCFTRDDFSLARVWATEVGHVLQKAELYQRLERMATTDALTGTYNRHYLTQRWPTVIADSARDGSPVALLMLDCFNFKQVNDRYGHTVGDELLQELGRVLMAATPAGGFTARYGGDEFLIVLPNTGRASAEALKEEIEHRLSLVQVARPDFPPLTVDFGVFAGTGGELVNLLTQVDKELYEDRDQASYQRLQALLETSVGERSKQMVQAVMSLAKIQEINDPYTRGHSERAKEVAMLTARRLGMNPTEVQIVGFAAVLHDVGKIVVPATILHKPGPLTEEEWRIMRMHPVFGANIVGELDSLKSVKPLVMHHHERFDGVVTGQYPGYPAGLKGEEIPLGARIIAVVDAYDAMTTDRVYRQGRSSEAAMEEIWRVAGSQFDPRVVEAFAQVVRSLDPEDADRSA